MVTNRDLRTVGTALPFFVDAPWRAHEPGKNFPL